MSSASFRAFSCEHFDDGREFLRADYSVECSTAMHVSEEHTSAKSLAWLGILLYPVGISCVYVLLLRGARRAILEDRPTPLSKALGFLVRDFAPSCYYWEVRGPPIPSCATPPASHPPVCVCAATEQLLEAWKKLVCRRATQTLSTRIAASKLSPLPC